LALADGDFLSVLSEVLNDQAKLPDLDRFEPWRSDAAALDAPWPEGPC